MNVPFIFIKLGLLSTKAMYSSELNDFYSLGAVDEAIRSEGGHGYHRVGLWAVKLRGCSCSERKSGTQSRMTLPQRKMRRGRRGSGFLFGRRSIVLL